MLSVERINLHTKKAGRNPARFFDRSYEFVDSIIQSDETFIIAAVRTGNTVFDMIFQDDFCRAAEGRANGSKLNEHVGAVLSVLDHPSYMLQMSDCTGQPVQNGFCLCVRVGMPVGMGRAVLMGVFLQRMTVKDPVAVIMGIDVFVVHFFTCILSFSA